MRLYTIIVAFSILCSVTVESQIWEYSKFYPSSYSSFRRPKANKIATTTTIRTTASNLKNSTAKPSSNEILSNESTPVNIWKSEQMVKITPPQSSVVIETSSLHYTPETTNSTSTTPKANSRTIPTETAVFVGTEFTTDDLPPNTTEEPRENHRPHELYLNKRQKPQNKNTTHISQNLLPLPPGASAALVKPTKYHYYPHNQHIYLLPECAIQQVCNAVYVRLNWTQPLCACPSRYRDPCSASLNSDDQHTTKLMTDKKSKHAVTLVKTCEPTTEMRVCHTPRDWSLLALQNIRTGKSHYLVICRCPDTSILEGPMSHDQPTYASVPGIRVYGMMCVDAGLRSRNLRKSRSLEYPEFPWDKANDFIKLVLWD